MASIYIRFNCGCAFSTSSLEEAVKHSDGECHTLAVVGEVRCEKEPQRLEAVAEVFTRPTASIGTSFDTLRAKLERG